MTDRARFKPGREILLITAIVIGAPLLGSRTGFEASVPMGVVFALVVVTFLQNRRGQTWKELGLFRPASLSWTASWTAGIVVVVFVSNFLIVNSLSAAFELPQPDLSRFDEIQGDPARFFFWLIPIAWGAAAFGEEMLLRGFLLDRLGMLFGGSDKAWAVAVVIQALLFGLGHAYQGITGIIATTSIGLVMGAAFLLNGRNLWPLILAHGIIDTIGLTLIYYDVL